MDIGLTRWVWKLEDRVAQLEAALHEMQRRIERLEAARTEARPTGQ